MFTGIVRGLAAVVRLEDRPGQRTLWIALPADWAEGLARGASVAINGVCLTAVDIATAADGSTEVSFTCIQETLQRTTLGGLKVSSRVNIERALRVGDEIGGHHVTGHVDAVGVIHQVVTTENNREVFVQFPTPERYRPFLVEKGWIAIDGVSLTVVRVAEDTFSVCLIPETLARTTLGFKNEGDQVHLEFDGTAKVLVQTIERVLPGLVERYLQQRAVS